MQKILSDHNCEGQARQILYALRRTGLFEIAPIELFVFSDIDLSHQADDEEVWMLCQSDNYLLLTGNRRTTDGDLSLELAIRRNYSPTILPVLTIGDLERIMQDRAYCESCATRLAEIVLDLEKLKGTTRLYLS